MAISSSCVTRLLKLPALCSALGVSPPLVRAWCRDGMPHIVSSALGQGKRTHRLFDLDRVLEWLEGRRSGKQGSKRAKIAEEVARG